MGTGSIGLGVVSLTEPLAPGNRTSALSVKWM